MWFRRGLAGLLFVAIALSCAPGWGQFRHGGPPRGRPHPDDVQRNRRPEHYSLLERPPHRGEVSATGPYYFEVVYCAFETRVYVYDRSEQAVNLQGVQGQVLLQVPGYTQPYVFPLELVKQPDAVGEQDYLAASAELNRMVAAPTQATFQFRNLPFGGLGEAVFNQPFALTRLPMAVTPLPLTADDGPSIARQATCPVSKLDLGSAGTPVKVIVGQQVLYLAHRACIPRLELRPDSYLARRPSTLIQ